MDEDIKTFPVSISGGELADFYISQRNISAKNFIKMASEKGMSFYLEMVELYLLFNMFNDIYYCIAHEAEDILVDIEKKRGCAFLFSEFDVDLTHLIGFRGDDAQLLIIPFKDKKASLMFGDAMRNRKPIQYWFNQEFSGDNVA